MTQNITYTKVFWNGEKWSVEVSINPLADTVWTVTVQQWFRLLHTVLINQSADSPLKLRARQHVQPVGPNHSHASSCARITLPRHSVLYPSLLFSVQGNISLLVVSWPPLPPLSIQPLSRCCYCCWMFPVTSWSAAISTKLVLPEKVAHELPKRIKF